MGGGVRLSLSSQPNPTLSSPSSRWLRPRWPHRRPHNRRQSRIRQQPPSRTTDFPWQPRREFSCEWKKVLISYIANAEKLNSWSMCAIIIIVSIVFKISPHGWTRSQQVLPRRVPQSWSRSPANPNFISSDSMVLKNAPASTCWPGIALRVPLLSIHWIPLPDFKFV